MNGPSAAATGRLYLISHSSGSHLAGCAVTHDWTLE